MMDLDEPTQSEMRAITGRVGRMRTTLDAVRCLRQGGTTRDVHRTIRDRTIERRSIRTVHRDLLCLEVLGLVKRRDMPGPFPFRANVVWSARWPTRDDA